MPGGPVPPDPRPSPLQLGRWLDGEGAARLQEMGAEEWSPDSFEKSFERFNEFLRQATVCSEGVSIAPIHGSLLPTALVPGPGALPGTWQKSERAILEVFKHHCKV